MSCRDICLPKFNIRHRHLPGINKHPDQGQRLTHSPLHLSTRPRRAPRPPVSPVHLPAHASSLSWYVRTSVSPTRLTTCRPARAVHPARPFHPSTFAHASCIPIFPVPPIFFISQIRRKAGCSWSAWHPTSMAMLPSTLPLASFFWMTLGLTPALCASQRLVPPWTLGLET